VSDAAQLAVFVRGIDMEFNVTEELAALVPTKGTATDADLHEEVKGYPNTETGRAGDGWSAI